MTEANEADLLRKEIDRLHGKIHDMIEEQQSADRLSQLRGWAVDRASVVLGKREGDYTVDDLLNVAEQLVAYTNVKAEVSE